MNKSELIAAISEKADIKKVDAEKFLAAFIETVSEELKEGNKIQLVGFGTFETSERAARVGKTHRQVLKFRFLLQSHLSLSLVKLLRTLLT